MTTINRTRGGPLSAPSPAPVDLDEVLSALWLEAALRGENLPGPIVAVDVVERIQTVATKVRFTVTCTEPGGGTTRRACCVKGYFDTEPAWRGAGRVEATFYRDVAHGLSVSVPRCAYVGTDDATSHALIIMDDLVAAGARFLTALVPYSPDEAAASLAQLAVLHASTWDRRELATSAWVRPRVGGRMFPRDMLQRLLDDGRAEALPPALRDADRVSDAMGRVAGHRDDACCLVHGDAHAGNLYVDPDGQPGLVDWQVAHFGHWATDVAYHLAAVLSVADRRQHEAALLAGYLDELGRLRGEAPTWDDAWDDYRTHLAYGYYLWSITRFVDRNIVLEFVARLGAAMADHDTMSLLEV